MSQDKGAMTALRPVRMEPTLGQMIDRFTVANARWTPETDGDTLDIADDIRVRLMADLGLSKAQVDELGAIL